MTMEALDKMFQEQITQTPEEAAQLVGLEADDGPQLAVTGVQVDPGSKSTVIYHTVTGSPRMVPMVYAATAVLKRFRAKDGAELDGKFVFSSKPTVPYVLGSVKCLLHIDRPERDSYNSIGLPVCKSEHFPSEYEAENHTRVDHASAWERMNEIKIRTQAEEDRQMARQSIVNQNLILAGLAGNMQATDTTVTVPVATVPDAPVSISAAPVKPKVKRRRTVRKT
tara:strand:+ start:515 stop:1186 length:672 start_codon:yes stop_codon:yes gene_type:complete